MIFFGFKEKKTKIDQNERKVKTSLNGALVALGQMEERWPLVQIDLGSNPSVT